MRVNVCVIVLCLFKLLGLIHSFLFVGETVHVVNIYTLCCFYLYFNKMFFFLQPRLGPRPFTPPKLNSESDQTSEFSFDKVFSVPSAPEMNGTKKSSVTNDQQNNSDLNEQTEKLDIGSENEKYGDKVSDNENENESRTPTTAERRRLFEQTLDLEPEAPKEASPGTPPAKTPTVEVEPQTDLSPTEEVPFDDSDLCQVTSIAERRRLYENRSMSVQEPTSISPTPMRRRDSLKGANNHEPTIKEEPVVSRKPAQRQNSLEGMKSHDKNTAELATPTPKRTSTVFGELAVLRFSF